MKNPLKLTLLLLALLLPATAIAHDFEVDGIYYRTHGSSNYVTVTYKGNTSNEYSNEYSGDITIPNSVRYGGKTYTVTGIDYKAFSYCTGLTSIVIPNSITTIEDNAFQGCSGLSNIAIGKSVNSISYSAFSGCSGLKSITVANDNTYYDSRNNCNAIIQTSVNSLVLGCQNTVIPNSVIIIGNSAFEGCAELRSVNIPNSVTTIGHNAFKGCSGLTSVTISSSVTKIGNYAFSSCSGLTSVSVASDNPIYDSRENCNSIIETASNKLILGCKNSTIPSTITTIGYEAFNGCSELTSINMPNSISAIESSAFSDCSDLTSIYFSNSLTSIGSNAFYGTAWYNNQPDGLVYAGPVAYKYKGTMPNGTIINILDGTLGISEFAFNICSGLIDINIPSTVTNIGNRAFYGCSGLTSISIPNSVISIGNSAFEKCSRLIDVYSYISELSNISTGNDIFALTSGNYTDRTIHVPFGAKEAYLSETKWSKYFDAIVEMGFVPTNDNEFYIDNIIYKITSETTVSVASSDYRSIIIIPSQVTNNDMNYIVSAIADSAFYGNQKLCDITLPETISEIGNAAFKNCPNLRYLTLSSTTPPSINGSFDMHCQRIPFEAFDIEGEFDNWYETDGISPQFWLILFVPYNSYTNYKTLFSETKYFSYITSHEVTSSPECDNNGSYGEADYGGYYVHFYPSEESTIYTRRSEGHSYGPPQDPWSWTQQTEIWVGPELSCSITHIDVQAFAIAEGKLPSNVQEHEYCFWPTPIKQFDFKESGIYYNLLHDGSVEVTSGTYIDPCDGEPLETYYYTGDIVIPNSVRGYNVTSIDDRAFADCNELTSITIPEYVTHIGENAFTGCTALKTLYFNARYYDDFIEHHPFSESITTIIIGDGVQIIPESFAYHLTELESVTIPNSVTTIGDGAFYGCSKLTNIDIPNSVTSIGILAFAECIGLTSITIPNSVLTIEQEAFYGCSGLTNVIIGTSIEEINLETFYECPNLTIIKCLGSTPATFSDNEDVFDECVYQNAMLYVPIEVVEEYRQAYGWRNFLHIVGFYDYDFEGDGIYYKITGENEVMVSSGEEAYSGNVVIPETVTVDGVTYTVTGIGSGAFANDSLNYLTIPVSVTGNIASDAFEGCFVPSVYIIGEGAWADGALPTSVDTLYISSSVTGVEGLQVNPSVIYSYAALPPTCDGNSFTGYDAELHVPASSLAAYFTEPYWSNFINIVSDAVEPTGLSLENDSISIMVGNQITLMATVTPDNATPQQVFWASTNDSIAKIGPINGELTALKAGECDIMATLLDKTVVCHITVTEIAPAEVTISQEFAKLEIGSQLTLTATVLPEDATDKVITWTTTNSDVATVDSLGNVMAMGQGECFITATCRDKQAMCHVIVVEHFIYITLDEHRLSLLPNHMEWLTPTVTPVSTDLVVTSSNPSVAAARMANGKIQVVGITEGTTIIKVNSVDGYAESDSCRVTVRTQRGDVNYDGFINITDVTMMISQLMSAQSESYYDINADVNNDGEVNISDVTRLISHLMTGAELEPKDENPIIYETFTVNGVSFKMIKVEGGTFMMGATEEEDADYQVFKGSPKHQVTLSDYSIGETEVTQELWIAVMGSNPSANTGDLLRPVENVNLNDCDTFIMRLNALTGKEFRLPSEAEWEFAAHGGNLTQGYIYAGSDSIDEVAWYIANSDNVTHPVATKVPNELGLYDMNGNAEEWCNDWYYLYTEEPVTNPTGPETGKSRVHRGGRYSGAVKFCRISRRDGFSPGVRRTYMGLRLAM